MKSKADSQRVRYVRNAFFVGLKWPFPSGRCFDNTLYYWASKGKMVSSLSQTLCTADVVVELETDICESLD